jgi:hypothetical protein
MKAIKHTFTKDQINAGTYIEFDLTYTDAAGFTYLPRSIQFVQSSGATVEFLYLANSDEKTDALKTPSSYEYMLLNSGISIANPPMTQYLRLRKNTGTATADMIFYTYDITLWKRS